jgi:adenylate cyclase
MPKTKNKNLRRLTAALAIGLAVTAITAIFAIWNPFNSWHLKLSNTLYTYNNPSDDIIVVSIDIPSIAKPPAGLDRFADWRRSYYAGIINKLNDASAKVIGVDLYFSEKSKNISQGVINNLLNKISSYSEGEKQKTSYETIQQYEQTKEHPDDTELKNALTDNVFLISLISDFKTHNNKNSFLLSHTLLPLSLFLNDSLENIAFVNTTLDQDGIVRSIPLYFYDENDDIYESLSLKLAQEYKKIDLSKIPLENGSMSINFFGEPYSFKYISFSDVYNDLYDPKMFKDKIVLIGVTTTIAARDHQLTPKNPKIPMPGVEIHANAIQTILDGKFLTNQTTFSQIATIAGIAIIGTLILVFLNIWFGIAFALLLILGYTGAAHVAFRNGTILNMIYPYIAVLLTYIGSVIYKYFTELKAKKYIQTAFSRYLSPNVLKEVLKDPHMLHRGGMKKEVTVFFSDIAGFTSISEKLDPEHLLDLINDYLATMTDIILKHEGTLDKYVGDAIVAYFGAPIDQADHAKRACSVALEMREALPKLHEKWRAEGNPLVDFRVGINTGEAIVGNVGSENRFDYTIMGDEVNLGSRLEGANKKYNTHIMISESTYNLVKDDFVVRELDHIRVKGKTKPVRVYELLAHKGKLSDLGQNLLAPYNQGMRLYLSRNFKDACQEFKKALEVFPDDGPSKLYLQRCDILGDYPPPEDWDGVFTMRNK